jgi:serine/threonine-protein kinase
MELVEGPDLRHELKRRQAKGGSFSVGEVAAVASAVAQALATAHAAGVVHRDVKPANVLLPESGPVAAKLGDFGIAHILGATRLTATGLIAGTPQFAAPEVVAGESAGPPADVYGLALCLYLMLAANRAPFDLRHDAAPAQWLRAHAEEAPTPVLDRRPDTPQSIAALVDRGLAKDPTGRPRVAEILEALGESKPFQAVVRTADNAGRRRPPLLLGAGLVGVALGVASVLGIGALLPKGLVVPTPSAVAAAPARGPQPTEEAETQTPVPEAGSIVSPSTPPTPPRRHESPTSRAGPAGAEEGAPPLASVPSATPIPSATAPIATSVMLAAGIDDGLLTLSNTSPTPLVALQVAMTDARGRRHEMEVNETLRPNEEILLALDAFVPKPEPGATPVQAEILVRDDGGQVRLVVLGPGRLKGRGP